MILRDAWRSQPPPSRVWAGVISGTCPFRGSWPASCEGLPADRAKRGHRRSSLMGTRISLAAPAAVVTFLSLPLAAWGHGGVELHVGTDYESCYFDLHPELTGDQFQEFAGEGGQIIRSRQLTSADTLGAGVVDVSLGYARFFLDDTKGAW